MDFKNILSDISNSISDMLHFGSQGVIGIDIGLSAIKLAEVIATSDGHFKINKFVLVDLPEGTIIEDEIQKEDDILQALQKGLKELSSKNKYACIGLSGPNTLIKRLQLPGGTLEEIDDQVSWETEQYLPFPIDEGNIAFSVVGENQGGGVDVIIGASKKTTMMNFKDLVERAGVKVKIVDLSAAATLNVFEVVLGDEARSEGKSWILMDIGAQKTHFMIYKNGVMVFFKEINIGGLTITEEIQRQMGVNYDEAESLKIQGDGGGNIPEEIVELINQVLDIFFTELKKTVDYWTNTASEEEFTGCFITGGSSLIPGLSEALQELFETEVQVLNPFAVMTYNQNNIKEDMINEIAHKGTCAIGLAMRSLDK
ncbi:MAG: pilus assembly protein PilM [Bdellovibrionales bacterium]|nr:pilus assembly protein PilM [Bdellovibrionales bacterium]